MKISSSILSANFANLESEIFNSDESDMIHVDVMDGIFVPNITIGSCVIKSLRKITTKPLDVHLMIKDPGKYVEDFIEAGSDLITIHFESEINLCRTLQKIREYGKKAGISIVPSTNPEVLKYILPYVDLVLIMTVNPGFGGQKFMYSQIEKVKQMRNIIYDIGLDIQVSVDGGIDDKNAYHLKEAGADILVVGSYIYSSGTNYNDKIVRLKNI